MKLLITTSFSLLELNTKNGKIRRVLHGDGLYYGLARTDKSIYVAARKRMVSSDVPVENERGEILVFDLKLELKERLQAPLLIRQYGCHLGWQRMATMVPTRRNCRQPTRRPSL